MSIAGPRKDEKSGTWSFVVDLGPGADGKRRQARRRGFATKKAAQEALDEVRVTARDGTFVRPERVTVAAYLDQWLDGMTTAGTRRSTITSYRRNLRLHVVPHVGGRQLQALSPLDLDRVYAGLSKTGNRKTGGALSARTVLYVHSIVHRALADAARKGLVTRNVADAASPPTAKAAKAPEMAWWRPDELSRFLGLMVGEDLFPMYRLASMSGMRRGECCGLKWADVDLDAGRVHVRQQIVVADHQAYFAPRTKSDHGRRTIDLDAKTVGVLRAHRAHQVAVRLAAGPGYQDDDLVFCHPDGRPLHPEAVSKTFERRVRRSGLPYIRLHDLRHTHAAHLIASGQDALVIAKRLGHASVSFTYDRYGHLMAKADSDAATAVAALVDGETA